MNPPANENIVEACTRSNEKCFKKEIYLWLKDKIILKYSLISNKKNTKYLVNLSNKNSFIFVVRNHILFLR